MDRGDEREDGDLAGPKQEQPSPDQSMDPQSERTEREWVRNRTSERREDANSKYRLERPSVPEQQMLGVLAVLGERYGEDYAREYKIKEDDGWFIKRVDVAWPAERMAIEVYGAVHRDPLFDRKGTRRERDAQLVAQVRAVGWRVLIVQDTELTQEQWPAVVDKVRQFLAGGRERRS